MSEFEVDVEFLISLVEERPVLWDETLETIFNVGGPDRNLCEIERGF
jgi:hypothetical protein